MATRNSLIAEYLVVKDTKLIEELTSKEHAGMLFRQAFTSDAVWPVNPHYEEIQQIMRDIEEEEHKRRRNPSDR